MKFPRLRRFTVRIRDFTLALAALVLLLPLMGAIGLIVVVESGRPMVFRQLRVGRNRKPFEIWKFRTMRPSPDSSSVTIRADARVTSVGRFLRKYKLDELPQLLNVLRGDMQVVGPRPDVPEMVDRWPEELATLVLSTEPGLSDPASLHFRDEADLIPSDVDAEAFYTSFIMPTKLDLSANYVLERSHMTDVSIICQTLVAAVFPRSFSCRCSLCRGKK